MNFLRHLIVFCVSLYIGINQSVADGIWQCQPVKVTTQEETNLITNTKTYYSYKQGGDTYYYSCNATNTETNNTEKKNKGCIIGSLIPIKITKNKVVHCDNTGWGTVSDNTMFPNCKENTDERFFETFRDESYIYGTQGGKTYNNYCKKSFTPASNSTAQSAQTNTSSTPSTKKPVADGVYETRFKVVIEKTDNPIVGAVVSANNKTLTTTNANGIAYIKTSSVNKDTQITVSAEGYETYTNKIGLASGGNGRVRMTRKKASSGSEPQNQKCGVVGKKECSSNYMICEKDGETRPCSDSGMLLPHTTAGECVAAGRKGYKICVSTKCEDNYEVSQGLCKKKSASATSNTQPDPQPDNSTMIMNGLCLEQEGDTGGLDDAQKTFCWCDSSMGTRCRLSHLFPDQSGICQATVNLTERNAACNNFCHGKSSQMQNICECLEAGNDVNTCAPSQYTVNNNTINGSISTKTNEPLQGATISVSGNQDTQTDANGNFTLENVGQDTIVTISYPGCDLISKPASELQNQNIELDCEYAQNTTSAATDCATSGGTINENGTCDCDTENAHLAPKDGICDCIDGYYRDETNACVINTEKSSDNTTTSVQNTSTNTTEPAGPSALEQAQDKYNEAKKTEQSLANRTLTAATTAATGLGLMTAASARAEQRADADAEQDMNAYLATFRCEYGKGQSTKAGNEEITLPGGNELLTYYSEYKSLADNLKNTKKALGLRSGIESEVVYDKAESNLYKYSSSGITSGAYTSLSRALTDAESADAAAWNAQNEETANKLKGGTIAAGAGVAGGIGGDAIMNTDMIQNIKNKFK